MTELFNAYIYYPILQLLIFIYQNLSFHDLGLSIIILTVFVRLVLLPIFYKGAKDQTVIQKIQPHVKKIQLDHKDDKERQARELMALYKEHRVNPFSSILFLIIQIPIFLALFRVFTQEVGSVVFQNHIVFLGFMALDQKSIVLAAIAAAIQYFQTRMMLVSKPDNGQAKSTIAGNQKMMMYIGPALTLIVLFNLPAAIGLYWTVSNIFSVLQQIYINKKIAVPAVDAPTVEKNAPRV